MPERKLVPPQDYIESLSFELLGAYYDENVDNKLQNELAEASAKAFGDTEPSYEELAEHTINYLSQKVAKYQEIIEDLRARLAIVKILRDKIT